MEKILVSACLLGIDVKYDGTNNKNDKVLEYIKDKEVIPVCPEIMGGLSTPRIPSEIIGDKVINKEGVDVTNNFYKGAEETLKLCKLFNIKKAILKKKSPSCGVGLIYDGTFANNLVEGYGATAKLLKENGIELLTEDDL